MIVFLILLVSCLFSFYLYMTRKYSYWKDRGVIFVKPIPILGNLMPILSGKENVGAFASKIYRKYPKEKYVGVFLTDSPCLIVRDHELVKNILGKDFGYFTNRIINTPKEIDPIVASSLFLLNGQEWKNTRAKISPVFTNKKQKLSFEAMKRVMSRLDQTLEESSEIDSADFCARISVDLISDAVLRLQGHAITDPKRDPLKILGDALTAKTRTQGLQSNLIFLIPDTLNMFNKTVFPKKLIGIIKELTMKALELSKDMEYKGDYIDTLMEIRAKGPWEGNDGKLVDLNDDTFVGQMFMFVTAGFETTSSGIMYCVYELARNPKIQEQLREEVKEVLQKYDGVLSQEALKEFTTLIKYVHECMRKHPPFPFIDRVCSRTYNVPGSDLVIEKGTKLLIPMLGLMNDEKYYHNPEEILLDRFDPGSPEADGPYFPFGMGPRTCLGMRFALQGIYSTLITILNKYRLSFAKDCNEISLHPYSFGNTPKDTILLKVEKCENAVNIK